MKNASFFLKKKRDKISLPTDFSIRKISCFDLFTSTDSFTEYNFESYLDIEFPENLSGYVNISPRGFAAFLRLIFSEIYDRRVEPIRLFATDKSVVLSIPKGIKLTNLKQLTELAERSGFSVSDGDDAITLRTPMTVTQEFFVFSRESLELINYYYEAFMQE